MTTEPALTTQELSPKMVNTFVDHTALDALDLDWSPGQVAASLEYVYKYTVYKANTAIQWYDRDAKRKKRWARWLRFITISFTALGGIFPVLIPILNSWNIAIGPTWATIVLAIAAAALGLDRFFGFSSAWIRSITTGMKLRAMLDNFQFAWEGELVQMEGDTPTTQQAQALVARCGQFVGDVATVVQEETQQWVAEFRNSLQGIDESITESQQITRTSALEVTVINAELADDGWILDIDTRRPVRYIGSSAVVTGLLSGLYKVSAEATIQGKPTRAERAVNIVPGDIIGITLTLEAPIPPAEGAAPLG